MAEIRRPVRLDRLGLALIATGASFVAKESGEQLEDIVGEPDFDHAEWGYEMPLIAGVLFLAALALWFVQRSYVKRENGGKALVVIVGILAAVVAAANLYWIFQVGVTPVRSRCGKRRSPRTLRAGGLRRGRQRRGRRDDPLDPLRLPDSHKHPARRPTL